MTAASAATGFRRVQRHQPGSNLSRNRFELRPAGLNAIPGWEAKPESIVSASGEMDVDEQMPGLDRADVHECQHLLVLAQEGRRRLAADDRAEDAVRRLGPGIGIAGHRTGAAAIDSIACAERGADP